MSLMSAYQDLVTSQHRGHPKYMSALTSLLQHSNDIFGLGIYVDDDFDLDLATGAQMDVLGVLVGASRILDWQPQTQATPVLDDDTYRVLLKAKIAQNLWVGGIEDLEDIWVSLFGERIKIVDNQDMTIDVIIENVPSSILQEMISRGMIAPKPQSVYMKYNFMRDNDGLFYIGGFANQYKKFVVSPARPNDQTDDALIYIGGIDSVHKRFSIWNASPTGADVHSMHYIAGQHNLYKKIIIKEE